MALQTDNKLQNIKGTRGMTEQKAEHYTWEGEENQQINYPGH